MFVLLYNDECLRRMTVLDTKDGVVETMSSDKVLDIMTKNNISIRGIGRLGYQCLAYAQPYPLKQTANIPKNCFIITQILTDKYEYRSETRIYGFRVANGELVPKQTSVVLTDDMDLGLYFFCQKAYVNLEDFYSGECYAWEIKEGICDVFADIAGNPYNANMGTEVSEKMWGDFICKILKNGYVHLSNV